MLQTRPSSASGILQTSQSQSHHQYPINSSQTKRNSFHGMNNGMNVSNYRGHTAVAPIAPYAFTCTPGLAIPGQRAPTGPPHLRSDQRTSSAPAIPSFQQPASGNITNRSRYPTAPSVSTTSSSSSGLSSMSQKPGTRDDSAIPGTTRVSSGAPRPHSTIITSTSAQSLTSPAVSSPVKASPDRYRRPNNRRAESSTNGQQPNTQQSSMAAAAMPHVMQFYGSSTQQTTPMSSYQEFNLQMPQFLKQPANPATTLGVTADDMQLYQHTSQDPAKRYRRRSIHTIDASDYLPGGANTPSAGLLQQGSRQVSSANGRIDQQQHPLLSSPIVTIRPTTSHGRNGSTESVNSTRSSHHSRPNSVSPPPLFIKYFRKYSCVPLKFISLTR
jgi:hypothetical protein